MPLLCRLDDGRVAAGYNALSRRSVATASEDNQVALAVLNHVYVLQTHRTYVEVVSKVRSDAEGAGAARRRDPVKNPTRLKNPTPEGFLAEQVKDAVWSLNGGQGRVAELALSNLSPRFVSAEWTPVAVETDDGAVAALCTISIMNRIEMWLPRRSQSEEVYDVEKICDLSSIVASHLNGTSCGSGAVLGRSRRAQNKGEQVPNAVNAGISICHFAPPPVKHAFNGFVGLFAVENHVLALWLRSRGLGETAGDREYYPSRSGGEGPGPERAGPPKAAAHSIDGSGIAKLAAGSHVMNQRKDDLDRFEIAGMRLMFPTSARQTLKRRVECTAIADIESAHVCSLASSLRSEEPGRIVYDVFAATNDGRINVVEMQIEDQSKGGLQIQLGEWKHVFAFSRPAEMLRVRSFHGDRAEFKLLIALVHNAVHFYNVADGTSGSHRCGQHPLLSYHTEPLFMRGGELAQVVLVDAVGTRYTVAVDEEVRVRECGTASCDDVELTTIFYNDTETTVLQVSVGRPALELRRFLRSPNVFATTLAILSRGGDLGHFTAYVGHLVHGKDIPSTDTMITRAEPSAEQSLASLTQPQFRGLAEAHPAFQLWRDLWELLGSQHADGGELADGVNASDARERTATLLYLVAYWEACGDTQRNICALTVKQECASVPLHAVEAVGLGDGLEAVLDGLDQIGVSQQLGHGGAGLAVAGGPGGDVVAVDDDDAHNVAALGLTPDENLLHEGRADIEALELVGGNVLTLAELEEVAGTVHDLEAFVGKELHDVASVVPAVGVERLGSLLRPHEVPQHEAGTLDEELPARRRGARVVLHLGNGAELEDEVTQRAANSALVGVAVVLQGGQADLGGTPTLGDRAGEHGLHVLDVAVGHGRGAESHGPQVAAEGLPDLFQNRVEEPVPGVMSPLAEDGDLGSDSPAHKRAQGRRLGVDPGVDAVQELGEDTGDAGHHGGLQGLHVGDQVAHIAAVVPDTTEMTDNEVLHEALVDVRQRQVAQVGEPNVRVHAVAGRHEAGEERDERQVRVHSTLGDTAGTGGVDDGGDISALAAGRLHNLVTVFLYKVVHQHVGAAERLQNLLVLLRRGVEQNEPANHGQLVAQTRKNWQLGSVNADGAQLGLLEDLQQRLVTHALVQGHSHQPVGNAGVVSQEPVGAVGSPDAQELGLLQVDVVDDGAEEETRLGDQGGTNDHGGSHALDRLEWATGKLT
ncbi:peptidase M15, putative [Babesia caballi]|uniref:Peptidase M15, putative n=1 Tax=Babesia caballi TaxID=5871 RepID=A0AAV4LUW1_BABCB|nr:peptidase M15, putative [Babesia caballi]